MLHISSKVGQKDFSGAKKKGIRSYIIATVEQRPNSTILNPQTYNVNNIDTPEEVTMATFNYAKCI